VVERRKLGGRHVLYLLEEDEEGVEKGDIFPASEG
jgi:hypothetical protein